MVLNSLKSLEKVDLYFLFVFIIGISLRIISWVFIPLCDDAYTYLEAAQSIIEWNYSSMRPPGFPFFIAIFLFLTGNEYISIKLTSFIFGILLILGAYLVFTRAAESYLEDSRGGAKYIGLFSTSMIALNLYLICNNGRGLREELMALLCLLIFYYLIIEDQLNLKTTFGLTLSVSLLTFTHLSAGLFLVAGSFLFFLISSLKIYPFKKISWKKIILATFSVLISFMAWALISFCKFGDPLYNWHVQSQGFWDLYKVNLFSIHKLLGGLLIGIPLEFFHLSTILGFCFTFLAIVYLIKKIKEKQILFLFLVVGINYAYLSIILSVIADARVLSYYFPYIIYIGSISIGLVLFNSRKEEKLTYNCRYLSFTLNQKFLLITYTITYIFRTFHSIAVLLSQIIDLFAIITLAISIPNLIINEILFFLLIGGNKTKLLSIIKSRDIGKTKHRDNNI